MMMRAIGCLLVVACLATLGCNRGPKLGKVTGTITWKGKPLEQATVTFTPDNGRSAFARTESDGSFTLKFSDGREGAVLGENVVTIETARFDLDEEGNPIEIPEILPDKYHLESQMVEVVEPGNQVIDFTLE